VHSQLVIDAACDHRILDLVVQLQSHTLMHAACAYGDIPKEYHVLRYPAKPG
jgi:hypothetical protein